MNNTCMSNTIEKMMLNNRIQTFHMRLSKICQIQYLHLSIYIYTIWLFNIAMENTL